MRTLVTWFYISCVHNLRLHDVIYSPFILLTLYVCGSPPANGQDLQKEETWKKKLMKKTEMTPKKKTISL